METTEILESETEVYNPVSDVEYVDDDSVIKVEDNDNPLNYLNDTTEYEEWFSNTEEVDAVTVADNARSDSETGKNHYLVIVAGVIVAIVVLAVITVIIRKRK